MSISRLIGPKNICNAGLRCYSNGQMTSDRKSTGTLNLYLKAGLGVSLQGESKAEVAATLTAVGADSLSLRLSRPSTELSFQLGERVLIKYWDEGSAVYYWEGEIAELSGPEGQEMSVVSTGTGVNVQRRKSYRVRASIPFSFTVIDAAQSELNGKRVDDIKTKNLTVGGLAFQSRLPLKVGDKLEITLNLKESQRVSAVGWVIRSRAVESDQEDLRWVGIEFLQLAHDEQMELMKFLKAQYE